MELLGNPWESCPLCAGSGLQNVWGPVDCHSCNGNMVVRMRDEKGRFTTVRTWTEVLDPEDFKPCPVCEGTGMVAPPYCCGNCDGSGEVRG